MFKKAHSAIVLLAIMMVFAGCSKYQKVLPGLPTTNPDDVARRWMGADIAGAWSSYQVSLAGIGGAIGGGIGFFGVMAGTGYSDFNLYAPLNVSPLVNWNRNPNGNVIGRVTVSGIDSDEWPQYATIPVEVKDILQITRPLYPVLRGRRSNSATS